MINVSSFSNQRDKTQPLDLSYANFFSAKLQDINFKRIDLSHTNFTQANLTRAKLKGTKLKNTIFNQAILIEVEFSRTNIIETNHLWRVTLTKAKLSDTLTIDPTDKTQIFKIWIGPESKNRKICQKLINNKYKVFNDLPNEDLKEYFNNRDKSKILYLSGATLSGANLSRTDLRNTDFINANLANADLRGAILSEKYKVSNDDTNQTLYDDYNRLNDDQTKKALKSIFSAKRLIVDDLDSLFQQVILE